MLNAAEVKFLRKLVNESARTRGALPVSLP